MERGKPRDLRPRAIWLVRIDPRHRCPRPFQPPLQLVELSVGPGDDADVTGRLCALGALTEIPPDELELLGFCLEGVDHGRHAVRQRTVAVVAVDSAIQVVNRQPLEQPDGPSPYLLGGAVAHPQLLGTTADVDAALRQDHLVSTIDPLMAVADDEQIVRSTTAA